MDILLYVYVWLVSTKPIANNRAKWGFSPLGKNQRTNSKIANSNLVISKGHNHAAASSSSSFPRVISWMNFLMSTLPCMSTGASAKMSSHSFGVNFSPQVLNACLSVSSLQKPSPSSYKLNACAITSSSSVPWARSPKIVKKVVKLIGPGASLAISSSSLSVHRRPSASKVARMSFFEMIPSLSESMNWKASLNWATWCCVNMANTFEPLLVARFLEALRAGAGPSPLASFSDFFDLVFFTFFCSDEPAI